MTSLELIALAWIAGVPLIGLLLCLLAPSGRRTSLRAAHSLPRAVCQPFRQRSASIRRLAGHAHGGRARRRARLNASVTLPERSRSRASRA